MRWEYKAIRMNNSGWLGPSLDVQVLADALNEKGREGWELVSTIDLNAGHASGTAVVAMFKRPLA
ncbi:MAG TPA: DUF4177 domain-containing protein [Longimicrobium sp.]|nr:DUF4177 domain-containing protein [Longimicrobium sp.]